MTSPKDAYNVSRMSWIAGASTVNDGEGGPPLVHEELDGEEGDGVRERDDALPETNESLPPREDIGDIGG